MKLLSGALCSVPVKWYTFLHARDNNTGSVLTTLQWEAFVQPLLQWKGYKYYILSVCVCSLRYPAWKGGRHIVFCDPPGFTIFFPYFPINGKIFEKKKFTYDKMWVLIFPTTFVWNISHSNKNWARCDQKCVFM